MIDSMCDSSTRSKLTQHDSARLYSLQYEWLVIFAGYDSPCYTNHPYQQTPSPPNHPYPTTALAWCEELATSSQHQCHLCYSMLASQVSIQLILVHLHSKTRHHLPSRDSKIWMEFHSHFTAYVIMKRTMYRCLLVLMAVALEHTTVWCMGFTSTLHFSNPGWAVRCD